MRTVWSNRGAEALPTADGQYFAQLIGLVDEGGGQQGWGGGAIAMTTQSEEVPMDLMDELAQHLSKDPMSALDVTLLMPNLGRIEVRANARGGRWEVELGFARRDVLKRLQPRQRSCEAALAKALGKPVELSMLDEACI
ncbi:type III secretion system HrpP C-terminal domain-containing protein [Pseudomonas sp. GL-B-16]|uniref:type III secretion system HrpP C-terminal domain-containing protein n=1 Tax=Pseudomonas sp. GL-B-16 TaxID=2832373 RepID=UPI001CBB2EFC|nr:type III secretion system HrpP C-terminal domain-containing protein [Pseudomonas sp. GL-B-16]